uniref:Beta-2-glycoprotein 1 n=1 Tax=Tetraodon nigroviridis TaxID=99883 RepID=H3C0L6_TETNG
MDRNLLLLSLLMSFIADGAGQDNVCHRPELGAHIQLERLQRFFSPGDEITLVCQPGYTPVSGPRKIICRANGEWTKSKLLCIAKSCPYPEPLLNGELEYEDTVYQSTINYTCQEGFIIKGARTLECLSNGQWSNPVPECQPVQCGLAPIPQFGGIVYDSLVSGNWTKTPECRVVTCPPPEKIERGYMSINDKRRYDYMETIKYGCHGDFVIEGNQQIVCQKYGNWSEKPSCKAPCPVGIHRGRILYREQKLWIKELKPKRILHSELISVYCMNTERKCGYAVSTQCIDGNLKIPECFEEPSLNTYNLHYDTLPSEITQC